jgi:large subunit ribosomal protein L9
MASTRVLLREDIDHLGGRGDIVRVKAGYARNYLLPRKLAVQATASNVKQIEQERAALLKREATERVGAEAQAEQMRSLRLDFQRKVGEHGMLYGSVTSMDIAEALKERGYEIDRRKISLKEAIKEKGEFSVNVRLHREVNIDIPIFVVDEGEDAPVQSTTSEVNLVETVDPVETKATDTDESSSEPSAETQAATE